MFISYANPNSKSNFKNQQHLFRDRNNSKNRQDPQCSNDDTLYVVKVVVDSRGGSTKQPQNFTAHQFLNYVSSDEGSPTTRTHKGTNATRSSSEENIPPTPLPAAPHEHKAHRLEKQQAQEDYFAKGCLDALQVNCCGLSNSQAKAAADAFLNAATKTGTKLSSPALLQQHLSFCQGAVNRALGGEPLDVDNVSTIHNTSQNAPKQHHLPAFINGDPSTGNHSQQQEEVKFLRSVVKNLIYELSLVSSQTEVQPPDVLGINGPELQQQQLQQQQQRVPSKVEFYLPRPVEVAEDDISEPVSLLSSSASWEDPSPPRRMVGTPTQIVPFHLVAPPRDIVCSLPSSKITLLRPWSWGVDTTRKNSLSYITSPPNDTLETTLQLLLLCKAVCQQPAKILLLEPGEVAHDRARGMKVQLVLQNNAHPIRGTYNGSIDQGVPHGSGVLRFDNRDLYLGEFRNGFMHGQGTLFCRSTIHGTLAVYRGEFRHNEFWGGTRCDNDNSNNNNHRDDTRSAGAA